MVGEFPACEKFSHWNSMRSTRPLMDQSKELGSLRLSNRAVNAWKDGGKNWTAASNSRTFAWLGSRRRHWRDHVISESLEEEILKRFLPGHYWRLKSPAYLPHLVATRLWQPPGLKLYSKYQEGRLCSSFRHQLLCHLPVHLPGHCLIRSPTLSS